MPVALHEEKILESWGTIIENGQGNQQQVFSETERYVKEADIPAIGVELTSVTSDVLSRFRKATISYWKGAFKGDFKMMFKGPVEEFVSRKRDYLMVTNVSLKDYRMYIGARDYGNNLDVSWYLTCEPGFLKGTVSKIATDFKTDKAVSFTLDIFDQQDLQAYVTVVHHCLLKAVEGVMVGIGQDPSKIDRKSRGFLGIS